MYRHRLRDDARGDVTGTRTSCARRVRRRAALSSPSSPRASQRRRQRRRRRPRRDRRPARRNGDDTSRRACERWLPTAAATPRSRARGTRWRRQRRRRRHDAAPRSHRCELWPSETRAPVLRDETGRWKRDDPKSDRANVDNSHSRPRGFRAEQAEAFHGTIGWRLASGRMVVVRRASIRLSDLSANERSGGQFRPQRFSSHREKRARSTTNHDRDTVSDDLMKFLLFSWFNWQNC